jgi:hypothetical protein
MADKTFDITYDGPALASGTMPVRDLAPSLLSLAEIFTTASLVVFPTREPVSLEIKATAEGSFEVELIAHTVKLFDDAVDIFGSNPIQALEGLVFTIVGAQKSLFWLIKSIGSQKVVQEESATTEPGHVTLTLEDGTKLEGIPTDVVTLYKSLPIRRQARQVVTPLYREGVDVIRFKVDSSTEAEVTKDDLPAYEVAPGSEDVIVDVVQPMVLEVVSPVFEEGNKWRFNDGERKFSAAIDDEEFIARVNAGEAFAKGDLLHCDVRVIQSRVDGKLSIERRIVRVREHHRASDDQLALGEGD